MIGDTQVTATKIDLSTFPWEVTGFYPVFYSQPNATGTAGNSYNYTVNLPRTAVAGETVMLIPVAQKWAAAEYISNTTTQFTFTLNCVVSTSLMTSKWSAIYFKAH
jgi:hypothetical protein